MHQNTERSFFSLWIKFIKSINSLSLKKKFWHSNDSLLPRLKWAVGQRRIRIYKFWDENALWGPSGVPEQPYRLFILFSDPKYPIKIRKANPNSPDSWGHQNWKEWQFRICQQKICCSASRFFCFFSIVFKVC